MRFRGRQARHDCAKLDIMKLFDALRNGVFETLQHSRSLHGLRIEETKKLINVSSTCIAITAVSWQKRVCTEVITTILEQHGKTH